MLKQLFFIAAMLVFFTSCNNPEKSHTQTATTNENTSKTNQEDKVANAIKFINAYNDNSNKMGKAVPILDWVNANTQSTQVFKTELKKIIDEADPEMGLDADPIIDAQDNPSKGFELESFDEASNYLTVHGIEQADFKITMKVVEQSGNYLVDGCGIVNIPQDKRAKR